MAKKPDPNNPIWHQNPPNTVPDRIMPLKPGALDTIHVPETDANPGYKPPKPKPQK